MNIPTNTQPNIQRKTKTTKTITKSLSQNTEPTCTCYDDVEQCVLLEGQLEPWSQGPQFQPPVAGGHEFQPPADGGREFQPRAGGGREGGGSACLGTSPPRAPPFPREASSWLQPPWLSFAPQLHASLPLIQLLLSPPTNYFTKEQKNPLEIFLVYEPNSQNFIR